ncbi:TRAP transporter small permease subunit [Thiopseudomonas alkaliphila]|uniref:TRAP transporter small permease subunit n=1 Tax=Thiopseudomonas alkaliphila TaxID=1697053 RepID=UPI0025780060|nr:TRAP transporter small permease subunit [Thiopseudomonas alkaliphila]MDM1707602.1 TRAP transporter small permease subunit [Thiopseudomonas alkaliphila]
MSSPSHWLLAISELITALNRRLGQACAWLVLFLVFGIATVVVLRYAFGIGATALQEAVMYAHALTFMGTAAWALQRNAHVRVDIFYQNFSPRKKATIDALGNLLLLLPVCLFLAWNSWSYVVHSWAIMEKSGEAGGLAYVYLQKSIIILLVSSLILQSLADFIRYLFQLSGRVPFAQVQHD